MNKINSQKGFVIPLVIAIVVILIGGGIYLSMKKDTTKNVEVVTDTNSTSTPVMNADWKTFTHNHFGFSFTYPNNWIVTETGPGSEGDRVSIITNDPELGEITIVEIASTTADDSTGKWGAYIIGFDKATNGWVVTQSSERDGSPYTQSVKAVATTKNGMPIFNGGIHGYGWGQYDYILALSTNKFLIISGHPSSTSNSADTLLNFVKSITN